MAVLVPPSERIPGVTYALTNQEIELPVIDVTQPSFAIDQSESALHSLRERIIARSMTFRNSRTLPGHE